VRDLFLHIGENLGILWSDIVAIFDIKALNNPDGEAFLNKSRKEGRLVKSSVKQVNAYVITSTGVYPSSIKASTLRGRIDSLRSALS
jgi:hypothetical protein